MGRWRGEAGKGRESQLLKASGRPGRLFGEGRLGVSVGGEGRVEADRPLCRMELAPTQIEVRKGGR